MAQIGHGTENPAISPVPIFLRHTDYEFLDFLSDVWSPRSSLATTVILVSNELAVPDQQCVWGNEVGNFAQYSTADKFRFRRQPATLIIGKPKPTSAKLLFENSILFAQVLDGMLLLLVHPPSDGDDYEPEWI